MKFLLCIDGDVSRGEDSQAPRSKPREREKVKPRASGRLFRNTEARKFAKCGNPHVSKGKEPRRGYRRPRLLAGVNKKHLPHGLVTHEAAGTAVGYRGVVEQRIRAKLSLASSTAYCRPCERLCHAPETALVAFPSSKKFAGFLHSASCGRTERCACVRRRANEHMALARADDQGRQCWRCQEQCSRHRHGAWLRLVC